MSSAAEIFQTIVNERRSIRAFKSDPVSREIIDAVFAPALRAPSNCNTQPWFVHIVTGDKLEQLREKLPAAFAMGDVKVDVPEPLRVAGFDATWPVNQDAPLNPDGSVRSF